MGLSAPVLVLLLPPSLASLAQFFLSTRYSASRDGLRCNRRRAKTFNDKIKLIFRRWIVSIFLSHPPPSSSPVMPSWPCFEKNRTEQERTGVDDNRSNPIRWDPMGSDAMGCDGMRDLVWKVKAAVELNAHKTWYAAACTPPYLPSLPLGRSRPSPGLAGGIQSLRTPKRAAISKH